MKKLLLIILLTASVWGASAQTAKQEQRSYSVYFAWNKWAISSDAQRAELGKALDELGKQPEAKIAIVGWSDRMGSERNNKIISSRRARSVQSYLVKNGITADRITVSGDGVDKQAANNEKARRADVTLTFYVQQQPVEQPKPQEPKKEDTKAEQPKQEQQTVTITEQVMVVENIQPAMSRWSVGASVGVPFFWGDMVSMSKDKTYLGIGIGVQGSYRISKLLGISLSADWAQGKTGVRGYSKDYLLSPDGMTYYTPTSGAKPYADLYTKISAVSIGASLDVNVNRIFCRNADHHRFTAWVSPTVYAQFFGANTYTQADDKKSSNGTTKPDAVSLGLGGSVSLRYKINSCIDLQLKNSIIWITDNKFDGIVTPYGNSKQNAMWTPQIGVIWNIK